jgi:hypothetical protein
MRPGVSVSRAAFIGYWPVPVPDWAPPFIVPLVEPLLIEPLVEEPAPMEPAPIVPLVEPLLIEPDVSLAPPPALLELFVFSVLDPAVPGEDMVGVLGVVTVPETPAVCASASPDAPSENASVAARSLRDIGLSPEICLAVINQLQVVTRLADAT